MEKVYNFSPRDPSLFESDVPLLTRVLIDAYEDNDEPSTGHRVVYLDIEVDIEDGFPNVDEGDKEITAVAIYDDLSKKYTAFILDKDGKLNDTITDKLEIYSIDTEESLISRFLTRMEEIQPSIITGWNVSSFDMPYLYNRISSIMGKKILQKLSPIDTVYINKFSKELVIAGVSILDYMILYKKFIGRNESSFALGSIGKKVVNMEKISYTGSLNDLYKTDIQKYIEYNLNDVKIVVALDEKLKFIDLARNICHTGHVPYEFFGMSSRYIEGAILLYMRRQGVVATNKPMSDPDSDDSETNEDSDEEDSFVGAFVKDPKPGQYDWVYDLDLTSMYPNIMISLNISPETILGKVTSVTFIDESVKKERTAKLLASNSELSKVLEGEELEQWLSSNINQYDVELHVADKIETYTVGSTKYTREEFKKLLKDGNYSISSNGMMYVQSKLGIIPNILTHWFDERKKMRKMAKQYADEKNWEKYEFYDQRQKVQKILLNSAYGTLGLPSFRFFNKDNAVAVTLTGQDIIKTTNKVINNYYRKVCGGTEDYVIYVDTDSVFTSAIPIIDKTMPTVDKSDEKQMTEAILKVASEVQVFINKFYDVMSVKFFNVKKHRFDIKQEVIAKSSFWLAKKRYCQLIINKGGVVCDEIEIKGIDVVRTGFPIIFRKFMSKFISDILNKVPADRIDGDILTFLTNISDLTMIDLAKNTSVKFKSLKRDKNYNPKDRGKFQSVSGSPAPVKGALMYNDLLEHWGLTKFVPPIFSGQKIKWLYLKDNEFGINALSFKADGTDPKQILEFLEKYIDRNGMYEHELKGKLKSFYDILGWPFPSFETKKSEQFFDF